MPCPHCGGIGAACVCVLNERIRLAEQKESAAIAEAYKYRRLWQAAASCLEYNRQKIKPRGADEKRLLTAAENADYGPFWSGKTDGWL